jgi:hypothetical protein
MKRLVVLLTVSATVAAACSSGSSPTGASEGSSSPTVSATSPAGATLVGRWQRTTSCQELVDALDKAGMRALAPGALSGSGLVSGSAAQLAHRTDICKGATPRVHSHFFTDSGAFGSVDWNNQQVDDGSYKIMDDHTLVIGKTTFHYRIEGGDTLTLDPVIPAASRRRALAHPQKFSAAAWSVTVAYPGMSWERVSCSGWC